MQRVIWSEYEWTERPEREDDEAGYFFDLLEERLERLARHNGFGLKRLDEATFVEQPLDEHVVEMARNMGLDEVAATRWRDLPQPPPEAFVDRPQPVETYETHLPAKLNSS